MLRVITFVFLLFLIAGMIYILMHKGSKTSPFYTPTISKSTLIKHPSTTPTTNTSFPLAIVTLRHKAYPGSNIKIELTLSPGVNYNRYVVSYLSDGLTVYGLLTVPQGQSPTGGWPVILFNHGYIPPTQYSTISSYASFIDPLAQAGYIVFKPDFRGNGNSQGTPTQVYVSAGYTIDSLSALASIKKYPDANPKKIAVVGHSMGGNITLHDLVIAKDFKAAVLLSGVVGSYTDILAWWNKRVATGVLTTQNDQEAARLVQQFVDQHGNPQSNPTFWNTIDPTYYIADITAPVQILVGTADTDVPPEFSTSLRDKLQGAGKIVDFHEYSGADHNLAPDTSTALKQALSFLQTYVK